MIHAEFRHHAMQRVGRDRWLGLLSHAGLPTEAPRLSARYPDEDLGAAVGLLAKASETDAQTVLLEFGTALFPTLLATYGDLIPARWDALDLVEHTETVIHRAVRLQDRNAAPPRLTAVRVDAGEVRVIYNSPRQLCSLARGLLTGAGEHFGQPLTVAEERCAHRGDGFCEIVVTSAHGAADPASRSAVRP